MRDLILAALRSSKADYTEIRVEERESTQILYRGEDLETASAVIDRGGIVRCLVKSGGWGVATFNDLTDLSHRVRQAYEGARSIQGEPVELAPTPVAEESITVSLESDFRGITMTEKTALAKEYNSILLGYDPHIVDTQTGYRDSLSRVTFANSEGTLIQEEPSGRHRLPYGHRARERQRSAGLRWRRQGRRVRGGARTGGTDERGCRARRRPALGAQGAGRALHRRL